MSRVHGAIRVAGTAFGRTGRTEDGSFPFGCSGRKRERPGYGFGGCGRFFACHGIHSSSNVKGNKARADSTTVALQAPHRISRIGAPCLSSVSAITCRHAPQGEHSREAGSEAIASAPTSVRSGSTARWWRQAAFGAHARGKDLAFLIGCRHDFPVVTATRLRRPESPNRARTTSSRLRRRNSPAAAPPRAGPPSGAYRRYSKEYSRFSFITVVVVSA